MNSLRSGSDPSSCSHGSSRSIYILCCLSKVIWYMQSWFCHIVKYELSQHLGTFYRFIHCYVLRENCYTGYTNSIHNYYQCVCMSGSLSGVSICLESQRVAVACNKSQLHSRVRILSLNVHILQMYRSHSWHHA